MNNDKWKAVTSINTALHLSLFIFSLFMPISSWLSDSKIKN